MLDINFIRQNPNLVKQALKNRQIKFNFESFLDLDKKRRDFLVKIEKLRADQNKASREIARLFGKEKQNAIQKAKKIVEKIKKLEPKLKEAEKKFANQMLKLPNIPKSDVPIGKNERDNKIIKQVGKPTKFRFKPKNHVEIGEKLDLIDVKRAAKVSGSRFGYLKNEAALLEFALVKFVFDFLTKKGFIPIIPPVIVSEKVMSGMGYLTKEGEEDAYHFEKDKIYFVGTSEQSVIPMHMNEIFVEEELPKRYVAFSSCFRREAGAWGKDTKGILRVHQFDKVEMISYTKPEDSDREHKFLLSLQEQFVQALKIPYQVVNVCTGDLAYPSARTYDLECFLPSQNKYRETHSTSTCTDFQARRLNIRFKKTQARKDTKTHLEFVHTLNGTAFAIGRILIAILENYQQKDGNIKIPQVLRPYMNNLAQIKR